MALASEGAVPARPSGLDPGTIDDLILKCPDCGAAYQNLDSLEAGGKLLCNNSAGGEKECGGLLRCYDSDKDGLQICRNLTMASLILLLPALFLPMMEISQIGIKPVEKSIIMGVWMLISSGEFVQFMLGTVLFLFSIAFPVAKAVWLERRTRASTQASLIESIRSHRGVKKSARWAYLDVIVIGFLVPFLQLGKMVDVSARAGAGFFILMALLSSVAIYRYNAFAAHLKQGG